jgi:hypothetical protein
MKKKKKINKITVYLSLPLTKERSLNMQILIFYFLFLERKAAVSSKDSNNLLLSFGFD